MRHEKYIVLFTLFVGNLVDQPAPEVIITQGILRGKISANGVFFEYIGIPYASTNRSNRFQAPGPPPSWKGIYKAVDEIYFCPQLTPIGIVGSEDCLKINVYVPAFAQAPIPVMVYIHGGTFVLGGGGKLMYGPDFLIEKNVIVVTFNYRLGLLGFLCLGIKEAPGNAGLKDQIAALRWIKMNIAAFGGDPNKVTVFGESAGGTSISLLLASEEATSLFDRAIVQSGSALSSWVINTDPIRIASHLARTLGYNTENPLELYKIFSGLPTKKIIELDIRKSLTQYFDTHLIHLPCIEKTVPGEEMVLKDLPYNLFAKKSASVPVIYGFNSKEGLCLISEDTEESLERRNGRYLFASDLHFKTEDEATEESEKIQNYYFGKDKISINNVMNMSMFYTHFYFEVPTLIEANILLERTNTTIYNYYFNYSGMRSFMKMQSGYMSESGASHGDDLFYLFKAQFLPFTFTSRDRRMIEIMTTLWTNFAKYGDPTPDPMELKIKWMPSTKNQMNFLYLDDVLKMGPLPNPEPYRLWKALYDKYRKLKV